MSKCLSLVFAMSLVTTAAIAQDTNDAEKEEAQQQIEQLVEQQNKLADQYNAILQKLKREPELVALDKAIEEAKAKLAKAESANDALAAARAAELEARDAVRLAVEQKLKEHGEAAQLIERLAELQAKRAENLWQIELAKFQMSHALSPINRALAGDAELAAAKAKLDAAAADVRAEARSAYEELRAHKLADIVEAQRLSAIIEDASAAAQRMQESMVAVEERLMPIRKQIERVESKRIEAARDKVAEALNSEAIVALRKEVNDCVTEYNALITKLVAENEEAVRSKAEYEEVKAKIKALRTSTD